MSEHTREQEALYNSFRVGKFVEKLEEGWVFALGDGEEALVPTDDVTADPRFAPGDEEELLIERPYAGRWHASISKVAKLQMWDELERLAKTQGLVEGTILGKNKGGLSVDIGLRAFLPMSQVDIHRVHDVSHLIGRDHTFVVTEFDRERGNVVISRRAILEASLDARRGELLDNIEVGQTYRGTVRNVLDYGAFVDIGGVEGLLHASNMSWGRVDHPRDLLAPGAQIDVVVLDWNRKRERLGLGRKQLLDDPWTTLAERFSEGDVVTGRVANLADFGAFVALAPGLDGLVHVTELSWTQRIAHPREVLSVDQQVEVKIVSIDPENRRLGLSLKQLQPNPWEVVAQQLQPGAIVQGAVKSVVDFGIFIELAPGVDGLVHVSDFAWGDASDLPPFEVGQVVEAKLLDLDAEAGRASLGIKQLTADPWEEALAIAKVGARIPVTITRLTDFGAFAEIVDGVEGLIHISELADRRVERPAEVVKPGQSHEVLVLSVDRGNARISLSLKRQELSNDDVKGYADEGSATALGDLLRERLSGGHDDVS